MSQWRDFHSDTTPQSAIEAWGRPASHCPDCTWVETLSREGGLWTESAECVHVPTEVELRHQAEDVWLRAQRELAGVEDLRMETEMISSNVSSWVIVSTAFLTPLALMFLIVWIFG